MILGKCKVIPKRKAGDFIIIVCIFTIIIGLKKYLNLETALAWIFDSEIIKTWNFPVGNTKKSCPQSGFVSNLNFHCTVNCHDIEMKNLSSKHKQLVPFCTGLSGYLDSTVMTSVPILLFKSPCLKAIIRNNCSSLLPVPNIVHYVWYGKQQMKFHHFLSVYSSSRIQKPCVILIHGDFLPTGDYWNLLLNVVPNVIFVQRKPYTEMAGKKIIFIEHKADITRLLVLEEYGGIYMDTDEILLKVLDPLRHYEFTLGIEKQDLNLANALILSARNTSFLHKWLQAYHETYDPNLWGYHSTIVPFKLSKKYPALIHVENKTFTNPDYEHLNDLFKKNFDWSKNYAIHLYIRFFKSNFDIQSFQRMNSTIGSVARYVLFGRKEPCSS